MTSSSTAVSEPRLLSLEQQAICQRLSALEIEDVSQRAQALLILEGGSTQPEAAEQSGLSIGQIRYMVKRFKEKGLDMFPAELLQGQDEQVSEKVEQAEEKPIEQPPVTVEESAPEPKDSEKTDTVVEEKSQVAEEIDKKPEKKKKRKKASKKRIKPQKPVKKKKSRRKRKKNKNGKG